jgi:hypothetical protein
VLWLATRLLRSNNQRCHLASAASTWDFDVVLLFLCDA